MPTVITAPVPESLDDPEAWPYHGIGRLTYDVQMGRWGYPDLSYPAFFMLAQMRPHPYSVRRLLVAVPDGVGGPGEPAPTADDVLGYAKVSLPLADNTHVADFELDVHPDHLDEGVEAALLDATEALAAEHDRTSLITWTEQKGEPDPGPGVLEPPTGSGRVDGTGHDARFLLSRKYVLEQAARYSLLRLPVDDAVLDEHEAAAAAKAGPEYRLVSWTDHAPDEWVDQFALLQKRMSTDVPMGDLDFEEEVWDAERIRTWERQVAESDHGYLVSAALHEPTQTLAAFTVLRYPLAYEEMVFQENTLVLREHRGRRLGMLVKVGNLRRLREVRPGAARVHTWNAEENSYMLDINVALGFRRAGVAGMWQKRVEA
jgi:GNAT superfamily N-acetyltransferase